MPMPRRKELNGTIQCIACKEWLEYGCFYVRPDNIRPYSKCKLCHIKHSRIRNIKNPRTKEQIRIDNKNKPWSAKDVTSARESAKHYGIVSTLTAEEWEHIVKSHNYNCYLCGNKLTLESKHENTLSLDHIIPLSRGGPNNKDNVAPVCLYCNSAKRNLTFEEFKDKVRAWSKHNE